MADEKKRWWKTAFAFVGGIILGFVSFVRIKRTGLSGCLGKGADELGRSVGKVVDGVAGAGKRTEKAVELSSELKDAGDDIGKSIERLSGGNERIGDAVREAGESVGRLKDLIRQERERLGGT